MDEVVPVVLGALLGAIIWRRTTGKIRLALSICAVGLSGASATLLSGEYLHSWAYILVDVSLATLGVAIGFATAHLLAPSRKTRGCSLL
jgi:hypothetical protein